MATNLQELESAITGLTVIVEAQKAQGLKVIEAINLLKANSNPDVSAHLQALAAMANGLTESQAAVQAVLPPTPPQP